MNLLLISSRAIVKSLSEADTQSVCVLLLKYNSL